MKKPSRIMITTLVAKTQGIGKYVNLTSEEIVAAIARHGIIKEDKQYG